MKRVTLRIIASLLVGASFYIPTMPALGDTVYTNGAIKLNLYYAPGVDANGDGIQFGDQIVLDPNNSSRRLTSFKFEYFLPTVSGNESVRLRFYTETSASDPSPGVKFFDSGYYHIPASALTDGATLLYDFVNDLDFNKYNIVLPDTFTWTVQFSGIDPGETAGLELYSPPSIGNNFTDFWQLNPDTHVWESKVSASGTAMDFGAAVEAVPEPSQLLVGILAGGLWLAVRGLRRKVAKA